MATLAEKLQLTLECKNNIKKAMQDNLNLDITDSTPLSEYATKLASAKTESPGLAIQFFCTGSSMSRWLGNYEPSNYSLVPKLKDGESKLHIILSKISDGTLYDSSSGTLFLRYYNASNSTTTLTFGDSWGNATSSKEFTIEDFNSDNISLNLQGEHLGTDTNIKVSIESE